MRPVTLFLLAAMLFVGLNTCAAQDDAEDVRAILDTFLGAALEGDVETATECLHEMSVVYFDPEMGVADGLTFIEQMIADDPPPEGLAFGEYEPLIMGDFATVIAPLEFPPGINGPPMPVSMGAVLIREDGEWRVLVMSMLADDMAPLGDPEVDAVFEAMAETLEPFGQQIGESILSGDPEAFLDLCLPEGIVAGPWGPENAPMAARVADVQDGTADLPKLGLVVGEANPQEGVRLLGMGCAWMAVNTIVKDAAGELKPARHTAICVFDAEEGTWSVLAGIEAAREE